MGGFGIFLTHIQGVLGVCFILVQIFTKVNSKYVYLLY